MNQIVTYQLQRAVKSNNANTLARQVNVATVLQKVIGALGKVYVEKGIKIETQLDPKAIFSGDERDLLEVLGNVLDNAFKYGRQKIRASVESIGVEFSGLKIIIEDDGPGISADKQEFVLQRGARADTLLQGQGIGLAVVTDIVGSYGGEIKVESSELGGARIIILFNPAALSG